MELKTREESQIKKSADPVWTMPELQPGHNLGGRLLKKPVNKLQKQLLHHLYICGYFSLRTQKRPDVRFCPP